MSSTRFAVGRGFLSDLRLAARRLLATPLFSLFAVLSLAVGVGVTTAVYSVVDVIFLRDLGIRDAANLLFVVTLPAHRASRIDPMVALRQL